ncbi:MAG: hypothetical protein ACI8T1_001172 [Verrucomicrobiales bacterium]|jgi:hypothetical protein
MNDHAPIGKVELIAFEGQHPLAHESDPSASREEEFNQMLAHEDSRLLWLKPRSTSSFSWPGYQKTP